MFIPAYLFRTDKLTDISYALTFVFVALFGYINSPMNFPYVVLLVMVCLWATRLGGYLLIRVNKLGKDNRFDGMRENFWKFLQFWLLQGVTVFVVMIPSSIYFTSTNLTTNSIFSYLGAAIWLFGLVIEGLTDYQKYKFINNPANKDKWIDSGVWKYSRHPNYFGEILVWVGVYLYVFPAFGITEAVIGLVSPGFIFFLLVFVSGIPILEKSADKRWGSNPDYLNYKKNTPVLVPFLKS